MNAASTKFAHALIVSCLFATLPAVGSALDTPTDPDLRKELDAAFQKGKTLLREHKAAEAIAAFESAAALAPKLFGPDHLNTAGILENLGGAYLDAHRFREAEERYRKCLAIREQHLGKDHMLVGQALNNLALAISHLGRYRETEDLYKRCLAIKEKGPKLDRGRGAVMHNLAALYLDTGRYPEAEKLFKQCIELYEAMGPKAKLDLANSLSSLAQVCRNLGRLPEAETHARRSLELFEAGLGKDSVRLGASLNGLAKILERMARYAEAEQLYRRGLTLREARLGKDDPDVATNLLNLGQLYDQLGRYSEAEPLLRRGLAIRQARLGKDSLEAARAMVSVANLDKEIGRHDEAMQLYRRSLAITEARRGKDHPDVADLLNNIASDSIRRRRYKEAEPLLQRCLQIGEAREGPDGLTVASYVHNLANVYEHIDRPREAESLYLRSLAIKEARYGTDHPVTAYTLENLGGFYRRVGNLDKAEAYWQRALGTLRSRQGKNHRRVGQMLFSLATLYAAMNRPGQALQYQDECLKVDDANLRDILGFSSEAAMYSFLETRSGSFPLLINIAAAPGHEPDAARVALDWSLRFRGIIFDTVCRYRQAQQLLVPGSPLAQRAERYRRLQQQLSDAALNPPRTGSPKERDAQLGRCRSEITALEAELNRALAPQSSSGPAVSESLDTRAVQKRLVPGAALVEYQCVRRFDFKSRLWHENHYFALVLRSGDKAPQLVDLGPTDAIDKGVLAVRSAFAEFQEKLKECDSVAEADALEKSHEAQFQQLSARLYNQLLLPLAPALAGAELLYLVPDGALQRLPFEALVGPERTYLAEKLRFAYLSSGRDLLRPVGQLGTGTVVFAGPDYRLGAGERLARAEALAPRKDTVVQRGLAGQDVRGIGWKPLPGAAAEADDIRKTLQESLYGPVKCYLGRDALEEVLKSLQAPRVLHLATHGFFLDYEPPAPGNEEDGAGAGWARGRLKHMADPLLRSGIVLAGANTVGDKEATRPVEDGWVTAEEIALLNLRGTELVVLSACQTGLGDVKTGEGVYGLRRAFLYAGARSLVTSLFEVPDEATRDLMARFYRNLGAGQGKLTALHAARQALLQQRRQTHHAAHPFFWASFILVGDPN